MSNQISITSLVNNSLYAKQLGLSPYYYRYRSCNPNFPNRTQTSVSGFSPADQYQKQKIIQNTVRVPASIYTSNLAPLSAYKRPVERGVCWNQMSDRPVPSIQRASIPTGFGTSLNRRHTSVTSSRPGCQTPGGIGCDIKHNSYDRYLNRLKGKGPLKQGIVPPYFGTPIPFNRALPVYGGKTLKTNIINSCDCSLNNTQENIYNNPLWQPYPTTEYGFGVGSYVYAIKPGTDYYAKAVVIDKTDNIYTIQFDDGTEEVVSDVNDLLVYYPCVCNETQDVIKFPSGLYKTSSVFGIDCVILKNHLLNV